jgi:CHAD domain-containing protein
MKDLRRCRKRAGRVRDMDVLTEYASTVHLKGEEDCSVRLLEHLGIQRRKYAKKLYTDVRRLRSPLRKDLKRTAAILSGLVQTNGEDPSVRPVAPKAAGSAVTLAVQLAAPRRLDKRNLHPYRLKVKELRNVLHMAAGDSPQFVNDLVRVKDAIGEWHDWEELASIATAELNHGSRCGLVAELKRIAGLKYEHALALSQALRSNYLRSSHPHKNRSSAVSPGVPREPVWDAIAMLAA